MDIDEFLPICLCLLFLFESMRPWTTLYNSSVLRIHVYIWVVRLLDRFLLSNDRYELWLNISPPVVIIWLNIVHIWERWKIYLPLPWHSMFSLWWIQELRISRAIFSSAWDLAVFSRPYGKSTRPSKLVPIHRYIDVHRWCDYLKLNAITGDIWMGWGEFIV